MEKQTFKAEKSMLREIISFILSGAEDLFTEKDLKKMRLVCDEILMNIISHAYPYDEGDITVCYSRDTVQGKFKIEFIDRGVPFDPLLFPEPDMDMPVLEREPGGMGIFIVKKLMNEIRYSRLEGKNRLELVKYFSSV